MPSIRKDVDAFLEAADGALLASRAGALAELFYDAPEQALIRAGNRTGTDPYWPETKLLYLRLLALHGVKEPRRINLGVRVRPLRENHSKTTLMDQIVPKGVVHTHILHTPAKAILTLETAQGAFAKGIITFRSATCLPRGVEDARGEFVIPYVERAYVGTGARGGGYGIKLANLLEAIARERGHQNMFLFAHPIDRRPGRHPEHFWARIGYHRVCGSLTMGKQIARAERNLTLGSGDCDSSLQAELAGQNIGYA